MNTADGQLVVWAGTAEQMRASLLVVGEEELANSPGQRGKPMLEEANQLARAEAVNAGFAKLSSEDAYRLCIEHQVPAAPVLSREEVLLDPQILHNGCVIEGEHPVYGRYRRAAPSAKFSTSVPETASAPSLYGEQSDEILEEMGYSDAARQELRQAGVVA
jgi:crotonobetainyl-CoA:carnitine CoA-transferase CaiB-like acyl-CoA transferase